jgi:hypothetical protein
MDEYNSNKTFMGRNLRYYNHKNNIGLVSDSTVEYNDYEILYSVLAHEEPEVLVDFIKNVFYFNSTMKVCIVLNCSEKLYSDIKHRIKGVNGLFNNPYPSNKKWATYSLFDSHLNNYIFFAHHMKLKFKYFIPLASNCMFHKDFTYAILNKELLNTYDDFRRSEDVYNFSNFNNYWHFPVRLLFTRNNTMLEIFKKDNIEMHASQLEGSIIDYETMEYIHNYIKSHNISEHVEQEIAFEEFLFASLYFKKNGKGVPHMCKVFWKLDSYVYNLLFKTEYNVPTVQELIGTEEVCVKNIPRSINNELRVYIRKKANNYVL